MTGAGFTYLINLNVQGTGAINGLISMMDRLESHLATISNNTTRLTEQMSRMGNTGGSAFGNMASGARGLIAQLGVAALAMNGLTTTAQAQSNTNAINFASGGAVEGAKNISFVRSEVERLGLPLQESMKGFKTLDAAMIGTGVTQEATRNIFKGTSTAVSAMGLTAEDSQGVFLALGQIMSKGKVSAEELRGQIGERLPGAFGIAAKSIGVTTQQLDKMLEGGKLASVDFLPKFAAELERTFSGALATSVNSAQANFNRFTSSLYDLKIVVGEQLLPVVLPLLHDFLIPAVKWIGQHIDLIKGLGTAALFTYGMIKTWAFWEGVSTGLLIFKNTMLYFGGGAYGFYAAMTILARNASMGFAETMAIVNAALLANPVGLVIGGLILLGGAIYYAWQKSETFRATIMGLWESIKVLGTAIWDFYITPLQSAAEIMYGLLTGSQEWIDKGINHALGAADKFTNLGQNFAQAYNKGWNQEMGIYSNQAVQSVVATDAVSSAFYDRDSASSNKPSEKVTQGINNITGGGAKQTTFNITIGKLQDKIEIHVASANEGIDQMGDAVLRKLTQVINNMQQAQAG